MAVLDWLFVGVLAISTLVGIWRGLVTEVLSWLTWLAAFLLAQWFAGSVADWLPIGASNGALRYVAGFIVVFVGVLLLGGLVTFLMAEMLSAVGLRLIDRLLGAVFGLMRGVLLSLAIVSVVGTTPVRESTVWRSSVGVRWSENSLSLLKPLLPQSVRKYLPTL